MDIIKSIIDKFGDKVQLVEGLDYPTFILNRESFLDIVTALKEDQEFNFSFLLDITAVDYEESIQGVYHLMNLEEKIIIRLKVDLDKDKPAISSLVSLYRGADLQERETFDLMGVYYEGHPNLKRVLCPDDFQGHPLRKDFSMRIRGSK
ncbi:NADH-quinone oxidoreductase subunit C [Desulfitibacter alkalitolerans]|uniref:NADH-quinone oxidoreductase subunit C n=1 Tax=Desulfitibacter alkalitolerans TaxID=264641 RepID=UPI00048A03D8|nr:NADH-quinone oxidoreductase subunit C [Desulfitibacter alkalitolerans]